MKSLALMIILALALVACSALPVAPAAHEPVASAAPHHAATTAPKKRGCDTDWKALKANGEAAGWRFTELPDGVRRTFMDAFNRQPPITHLVADHVYLGAVTGNAKVAAVAIVKGSCVLTAAILPIEVVRQLLGSSI